MGMKKDQVNVLYWPLIVDRLNDRFDCRALARRSVVAAAWIVGFEGKRAAIAAGGGNRVASDTDDDSDSKCSLQVPT
jgi:hypothetical protein